MERGEGGSVEVVRGREGRREEGERGVKGGRKGEKEGGRTISGRYIGERERNYK